MANILDFRAFFLQIWKQQKAEAEDLNFRVLMDCLNQKDLKKLKEAMQLSVHKTNVLVIQQIKLFHLEEIKNFGYPVLVFIIVAFIIF